MADEGLTEESLTLALGGISKALDALIDKAQELSRLIGSLEGKAAVLGGIGDSTLGRGTPIANLGGSFTFGTPTPVPQASSATFQQPGVAPMASPAKFNGLTYDEYNERRREANPYGGDASKADYAKYQREFTAAQQIASSQAQADNPTFTVTNSVAGPPGSVSPVSASFGALSPVAANTQAKVTEPSPTNVSSGGQSSTTGQTLQGLARTGVASFGLLPNAADAIDRKQRIYGEAILGTGGDAMMGPINQDIRDAMNGQMSSPNADVDVQAVARENNMAFNATGLARVAGWLQPAGVSAMEAAQSAAGVYGANSANYLMNSYGIQVTNSDGSRRSPEEIAKDYYERAVKPNRVFQGPEGSKKFEEAVANMNLLSFAPPETQGLIKTAVMQQIEADNKGMAWSMDPNSEFGKEQGALSSPAAEEGQYYARESEGLAISMDDAAEGYAKVLDAATMLKGGFNALYYALEPITGILMQIAGGKVALDGNPTAQGSLNFGRTFISEAPALLGTGAVALAGARGLSSVWNGAKGATGALGTAARGAAGAAKFLGPVGTAASVVGAGVGLVQDTTAAAGTEGNWADKLSGFWGKQQDASVLTHPWTGIFSLPGIRSLEKYAYEKPAAWLKETFGSEATAARAAEEGAEGGDAKAGGETGAVMDPRSLIGGITNLFRDSSEKSSKAGDTMKEAGALQLDAARTLKAIAAGGAGAAAGGAAQSWAGGLSRANTTLPGMSSASGAAGSTPGLTGSVGTGIGQVPDAPKDLAAIEKQAYDFLKGQGLSTAGIAAVMANAKMESTWNPGVVNSIGASGLFQWLDSRKNNLDAFAASKKKPWQDVGVQLEFLMLELQRDYPDLLARLKTAKDPAGAAIDFENVFERSGVIGYRPQYAQQYFDLINKGSMSQGTMRVTHDQIIQAHEGEIVVPSAISTAFRTALAEHQAGIAPRGSGNVQIYVTLMNSSDAEARRLVDVVQEQIREAYGVDTLTRT